MARGADSKIKIVNKILENFEGSFLYNDGKEIRIPMIENGEEVQIKVTLTCAKDNVVQGQDNALPGQNPAIAAAASNEVFHFGNTMQTVVTPEAKIVPVTEPTAEEKANVKSLLIALGL